jgi:hypothetical protein
MVPENRKSSSWILLFFVSCLSVQQLFSFANLISGHRQPRYILAESMLHLRSQYGVTSSPVAVKSRFSVELF